MTNATAESATANENADVNAKVPANYLFLGPLPTDAYKITATWMTSSPTRITMVREPAIQQPEEDDEFPHWELAMSRRRLSAEASARFQAMRDNPHPHPTRPSRIAHVDNLPTILPPNSVQE